MGTSTKTDDIEIHYADEVTEGERHVTELLGLAAFRDKEAMLDLAGFRGDVDVPLLGLEEMEHELTMERAEQLHRLAPFVNVDRREAVAIPVSTAPPDLVRAARDHDVDVMTRPEWDDES